jgi:tetratricopeptide (TPR) repeat protein
MAYPGTLAGLEAAATENLVGDDDAAAYDAVALFLRRGDRVCPGFSPSAGQLHHIVDICRLVAGMPLAIELAAAWLQVLRLDEIVAELRQGLDILATNARDAPARHRDVRAVFDHSWSLLDEVERSVLMPLSVFRGGFTRDAAKQVAGATLRQLASLVNKSFLSHDPDSGRFEFHELLRQYVYERLTEPPASTADRPQAPGAQALNRHAAYYAALVERCWLLLKGPEQLTALAKMEADIENIRAAWRFYLDQKNVLQLERIVNGLYQLYWIRGWNLAAVDFLGRAAATLADQEDEKARDLQALLLAYKAYSMAWLGQNETGFALAQESMAHLEGRDRPLAIVFACSSLDINAYFLGRLKDEVLAIDHMLRVTAGSGDKWLRAHALYAASLLALKERHFAESRRLAQANLTLCDEIGDAIGTALPLIALAYVALAHGDLTEALDYYRRSLAISEACGFHYGKQSAGKYLAKVTLSLGRLVEAEELLQRCLTITSEAGFTRDVVNLLYEFGRLRLAQERYEEAAELLALVLQHPDSTQSRLLEGPIRDSAAELLSQVQVRLPSETYYVALTRGRRQDLDAVITKLTTER